ncbi:MAG: DUF3408 domain-containing protein [Paludibacter sp.]|nr:DUF3408 domain-containing protein [Paludibacter sp.]
MKNQKKLFSEQTTSATEIHDNKAFEKEPNYYKPFSNYLTRNEIKTRQCVYISREVQQKIAKIVNRLSNGDATIGGYIDNVLSEHLRNHKHEINALYREKQKDLI